MPLRGELHLKNCSQKFARTRLGGLKSQVQTAQMLTFKLARFISALILLLAPVHLSVAAVLDNTGHLVNACRRVAQSISLEDLATGDVVRTAENLSCAAYLSGFLGGYAVAKGRKICSPNLSVFQAAAVYVQWGDRNAAFWHMHPLATMTVAFSEAFPCK